jgi:hypothetical protein
MNARKLLLLCGVAASLATSALSESFRIEPITFPTYVVPEVGALGFTPDGELVVALRRHGILMAQPTADPTAFAWREFSGDSLHNSCGMEVVSGREVLISQMAELTRVRDTDGDGIADDYETVSATGE